MTVAAPLATTPTRLAATRRSRATGCGRAAFRAALLALGLAGLAALAPGAARADEPDYSGYQDLLRQYVRVLGVKGEKGKPWDSRFDYEQLFIDERIVATQRSERLATIHTQLLSVAPSAMTPAERTAWALNAYNFLVIERMTLYLLVPGRRLLRYDSPKQLNRYEGRFFQAPVATVEGREYSLTGFERRFVYGDTAAEPLAHELTLREKGGDPRLQLALVKGSLCSGPILPWVYRADSLEAQLDRAARLALALPTWLRLDVQQGLLTASNRFVEESADLGGPDVPGLMPLIMRHAPAAMRKIIKDRKITRPNMFFEPNWKLNQFDHPAPKLPFEEKDSDKKP